MTQATASSEPEPPVSPEEIVAILADVAPEVLENVAPVEPDPDPDSSDSLDVDTSTGDITVPAEATDDIELTTSDGAELALSLPNGPAADNAVPVQDGIVAFDNNDGSITVPAAKEDGSVQVSTIISDSAAPELYAYEMTVPDGARTEMVEGGGVAFFDTNSEFVGGVAPPWARDATGAAVPVRYEVSGSTISMVVEHREAGVEYPVVADPWLGGDLFGYTGYNRRGTYLGQITVSARLSSWGWYWYTTGGGAAIIAAAGWSELSTKRPRVREKSSLKHQYDCHVAFGYAVWLAGLHWDLEKARPNRSNWLSSALSHRCNW